MRLTLTLISYIKQCYSYTDWTAEEKWCVTLRGQEMFLFSLASK